MRLLPIVIALALCLCACRASSDVDRTMQGYSGDVPGASVLVLRDGVALVRKSYGMAELETRRAATPATDYRLASVTKQFTAAAILLLRREGKLGLDDSIRHWLPSLPAEDQTITLRQLLTHTSGLIDYEDLIPADRTTQLDDNDVLNLLSAEHRLYFAPGSAYRYSNSGYVLLGLAIERASGQPLPAFLKQRIFEPLGMNHTLLYQRGAGPEVAERAFGYSQEHGAWVRTDQDLTSATRGDGGVYSSIDDLAKWDAALYDNRLLDAKSREEAFTPHTPTDDPNVRYGYGWRITGDTVWHSGESIGFRNVIVRWPKQHVTVIVLSNRNEPEPYRMALEIAGPYLRSAP
ncbi:MAG TPA: serine hydrolase domain-containing protein [Dyella sp.]|uniref:serine hydrolase domain-containing protein n=1 Tax=Dyella sp. TaxID=1869338 RepID=UPI002F94C58E